METEIAKKVVPGVRSIFPKPTSKNTYIFYSIFFLLRGIHITFERLFDLESIKVLFSFVHEIVFLKKNYLE